MSFTLDDFRKQISQFRRLGSLQKIMGRIPGMEGAMKQLADLDVEQGMKRRLGIVDSMTRDEKQNPSKTLDQGRRHRIAIGAGVELHEVNELVKQFDAMSRVMSSMVGKGTQMVRTLPSDRMK